MNYQAFLNSLNAEKLIEKIKNRLGVNYDATIEIEEALDNQFLLKISIGFEPYAKSTYDKHDYLMYVHINEQDEFENAEVLIDLDFDRILILDRIASTVKYHLQDNFKGE